jgi:ParB family chromosome partitioning protein
MVEIWEIEIDRIHPNRCLICDEDAVSLLCRDIACNGLREPLLVELVECWFRILDGEKRWRACKKLGLKKVKAMILEASIG